MLEPSDATLVNRTLKGNLDAYGALISRYQDSVFSVCFRVLGERQDAEDLTQDVFIRAYRRLETFDRKRPYGPWIRRISVNLCINFLNRRSVCGREMDDETDFLPESETITPEKEMLKKERNQRIHSAILRLPPKYRIAIELRHFHSLSYDEMADALSLPLNTVKSHLYRGRKQLAQLLAEIL